MENNFQIVYYFSLVFQVHIPAKEGQKNHLAPKQLQ